MTLLIQLQNTVWAFNKSLFAVFDYNSISYNKQLNLLRNVELPASILTAMLIKMSVSLHYAVKTGANTSKVLKSALNKSMEDNKEVKTGFSALVVNKVYSIRIYSR